MIKEVLLSTICDLKNGFAFKSKDYVDISNTLSCRMSSIRPGGNFDLEHNQRFLPDNYAKLYSDYLLSDGDIVIAMTDLAGDPKILGVPTIVKTGGKNLLQNQRVGKLVVTDSSKVFIPFLQYALNRPVNKSYYKKFAGGGLQINVSKKDILNNSVPLPPLDQQKKIAAILDAADAYRQKTKALITKYEELTQSLFLDMFGSLKGDKISLSTICDINPKKSEISSVDRSTLVSFMPMANVSVQGQVSHIEERTIDGVWSGFTYFKENDVVFAKITPCMENGKGAIMRNLKNSIGFGTTEFHVLRPLKAHSTAEYLFHLTHSEHFRALAEVNMTGSAGQKRVPRDFFDKFKVVAPPLILQNQFAERVQAIEAQKAQAQASLVQAEDLFNSLLQKAFKGELS
jgi:type I restriction enzyme S subunit